MHIKIFTSLLFLTTLLGVQQTQAQCHIYDLVATPGDCVNGSFIVTLDFQYNDIGNEGFNVQGGGFQYGNFEYADLPISLGPFPGDGTSVYEFVAIDNQHPDCSDFALVGPVSCAGGNCDIFDFVAEPGDCNSDGTYQLWLDFQVENPGNAFFDVTYQGNSIGFFEIADLPVVIGHFNDNGNPHPEIVVCINDHPDCCAEDGFDAPNCNGSNCNIFDMTAVHGDCINGMFFVTIDFEYENVGDDGFTIQGNGVNYGVFGYGDLPVVLGPFAGNGTTQYEFGVQDVNHPDCSDAVNLGLVECPPTGNCDIFDLVADPGDCNPSGTYNVTINFGVTNTNNNFFKVIYQGNVIVNHASIANLPYVIHNFQDNGEDFPVLVVCMNEQPDCCAEVEFQAPVCQPVCHIFEVVAEPHACDD
ncbi:MAG: hypothetical protein HY842_05040, partial [Bacteroidetes bacterium]|nr:hypothetical protein [Bacteroidota bacterium]